LASCNAKKSDDSEWACELGAECFTAAGSSGTVREEIQRVDATDKKSDGHRSEKSIFDFICVHLIFYLWQY
jgi:hypothetical protein